MAKKIQNGKVSCRAATRVYPRGQTVVVS